MRLEDLSGVAITFMVLAIIIGIGATILSSVNQSQCESAGYYLNETYGTCEFAADNAAIASTYATNTSQQGLLALDEMAGWQTTLAIIVIAAVVIGVIGFFYTRRN